MFVLVLGAQAYTYTFALDVNGQLPSTPHLTYYLYDSNSKTVLAYASADELQALYRTGSTAGNQLVHASDGRRTPSPSVELKLNPSADLPSGATLAAHTVTWIESTGGTAAGDPSHWKVLVSFNSDVNYNEIYNESATSRILDIVAVNQDRDFDAYAGYELGGGPVSWITTYDNDWHITGGTFSGAFTYSSVPEPTSGILLLLGVAGLALKRKRA